MTGASVHVPSPPLPASLLLSPVAILHASIYNQVRRARTATGRQKFLLESV